MTTFANQIARYAELRKTDITGAAMEFGKPGVDSINRELKQLRQAWANEMRGRPHGLPAGLVRQIRRAA